MLSRYQGHTKMTIELIDDVDLVIKFKQYDSNHNILSEVNVLTSHSNLGLHFKVRNIMGEFVKDFDLDNICMQY